MCPTCWPHWRLNLPAYQASLRDWNQTFLFRLDDEKDVKPGFFYRFRQSYYTPIIIFIAQVQRRCTLCCFVCLYEGILQRRPLWPVKEKENRVVNWNQRLGKHPVVLFRAETTNWRNHLTTNKTTIEMGSLKRTSSRVPLPIFCIFGKVMQFPLLDLWQWIWSRDKKWNLFKVGYFLRKIFKIISWLSLMGFRWLREPDRFFIHQRSNCNQITAHNWFFSLLR